MKRIQEKVKDIVEVRPYSNLIDYYNDPSQTVAAYYFTDSTSDLMAKWLDRVADVQNHSGAAVALAGYRGVGKSHFLAVFGALNSNPELRSRISDQHVEASAQRLKRRRYPTAYVRRGTCETILEEFKQGLAKVFETDAENLADSLPELLKAASEKAADNAFIIIIDTAFERTSRVLRDDGAFLGEIAKLAKDLNIFVGIALDDDISDADGVNAAIAQHYAIDFLDQEHLYKIVDTHIFPKNQTLQPLIHDIYAYFREVMPSFRWSEQRFSSLYPLHPVILENAPFVRLYAPDFALLGFASEAGRKILGRPANSLIALDEVFDIVENSLRKIDELSESFEAYDRLTAEVVAQIPVMQRLQAKLILKGLMLLSLDGNGTTASEISAAMLIYDENEPEKAGKTVENLLEKFSSALPENVLKTEEAGREIRYSLKAKEKDNLNKKLAEAAKNVSPSVIPKILKRFARERFNDWLISDDPNETGNANWMDSQVVWRGGLRRGRLLWAFEDTALKADSSPVLNEFLDWEVIITPNQLSEGLENENLSDIQRVFWSPSPLQPEEIQTICRYYVLMTDNNLRQQHAEQLHAAGHAHTLAVQRIWNRIFIEEGKFQIDGLDFNLTEEARAAQSISELCSNMLEPLFETHFPSHPNFTETLGMSDVSTLINDLFSGARGNLPEVQHLAEVFALPLGLVVPHNSNFIPEKEENLLNLPLVQEILAMFKEGEGVTVSLREIYKRLKQPPLGIVREAQHLVLAALVAQRQIEFVTSKGDRINRRSLDLKIIWDDIEGIAKPASLNYTNARLLEWAKTLTGSDILSSIETPEERTEVKNALRVWLNEFKDSRILERFSELSDDALNTKIWRIASNSEKTFGAVSTTVGDILEESIGLEEGLHRIADAFSDSEKEFAERKNDLVILEDFIEGTRRRRKIWNYLAICETTHDEKIEKIREKLFDIIEESSLNPNEAANREMQSYWHTFLAGYSEYFAAKHDEVMKSHSLQKKFEEILRSDEWWEFENLSRIPIFPQKFWLEAQRICRQFKELDCRFEVREMLKEHPFCACSFRLEKIPEWEKLPENLSEKLAQGRKVYRKVLKMLRASLVPMIERLSQNAKINEISASIERLTKVLESNAEIPPLTNDELVILDKAFESMFQSPRLEIEFPQGNRFISRKNLHSEINAWLDEMPNEPALLRLGITNSEV